MANTKEIQNRIKSIKDTQKITNAMYMISSSKLKRPGQILRIRSRISTHFRLPLPECSDMFLRWSTCTSTVERESRKRTEDVDIL